MCFCGSWLRWKQQVFPLCFMYKVTLQRKLGDYRKWRVCGVLDVSNPVQPQGGCVSVCLHSDDSCCICLDLIQLSFFFFLIYLSLTAQYRPEIRAFKVLFKKKRKDFLEPLLSSHYSCVWERKSFGECDWRWVSRTLDKNPFRHPSWR